ncbi:hypothetical protein SAMN05444008_10936 [Cnuella takakiae]|uniref:DUF5681 domain-containing protein n=1 Tax=Cnuella takakiae TaxID=1302690 RepID=A0A1M5CEU8_9BACT|nr:DUF5681 domain-containing protein [Cnuella takakiae]OLY91788.1 hypothetical protein BUE76_07665 [Cnuella takakiae]SHF53127.1 hypothetical protein SAMN05444008_10936 [Cnuella takakiae]
MPFEKGKSGNPEGRPKGSANKATSKIRELMSDFLEKNFPVIAEEFEKLEGRDKVKAYTDLLPYVMPKMQSISNEIDLERLTDEQLDELYNRIVKGSNN